MTRTIVPAALLLAGVLATLPAARSLAEPDGKDGAESGEKTGPDPAAVERGRALFRDTQEGLAASCADCHSLLPPEKEKKKAEHLGPGASLWGSAKRAGWRNVEFYDDVGAASGLCARVYQERKGGLTEKQQDDLTAFLLTQGPKDKQRGELPARKVEKKPKLLRKYPDGDKKKGEKLYTRYCTGCHNDAEDAVSFEIRPGRKRRAQIARRVRGYTARRRFKPDAMSYYPTHRLSDEQLGDILAYLGR